MTLRISHSRRELIRNAAMIGGAVLAGGIAPRPSQASALPEVKPEDRDRELKVSSVCLAELLMIFHIGDDNRDRTEFPVVNVTLIAINLLVFVVFQGMGGNDRFTYAFSVFPAEIVSDQDKVAENRAVWNNTVDVPVQVAIPGLQPTLIWVYLTLLTSMFVTVPSRLTLDPLASI